MTAHRAEGPAKLRPTGYVPRHCSFDGTGHTHQEALHNRCHLDPCGVCQMHTWRVVA